MNLRAVLLVCGLASLVSCNEANKSEGREVSEINMVDEPTLLTLRRAASPSEALRLLPLAIGDKVRILPSTITDESGASGMIGEVIGVTDSGSGATVQIEELGLKIGLSRNLLDLVDLPVGTDISMGDNAWINNQDGEWIEVESDR